MEQVTKEQWMQALLPIGQGGRINQLLSVMSGGAIQTVQWITDLTQHSLQEQAQALQDLLQTTQPENQMVLPPAVWQGAGLLQTKDGQAGLLVVAAYAAMEDFQQEVLHQQLQWLQQMQLLNQFPIRLLLLAFSKVPDAEAAQPGMLETWQWEEVLEAGVQMAIGQQAALEEVLILPMVAYESWLG